MLCHILRQSGTFYQTFSVLDFCPFFEKTHLLPDLHFWLVAQKVFFCSSLLLIQETFEASNENLT